MQQRSMGLKQPKKEAYHGWALSGDLELTTSPGLARTSLRRIFHSLTSWSLMGPVLGWAGADIVKVEKIIENDVKIVEVEIENDKKTMVNDQRWLK
jgi:hypothetical protein